jgi:ketosteroid isomerase-like protein
MSQENVDAARRVYDAFSQRDLDAFLGLMDAEVEFTTRFVQLEGAPPQYRGHDGVRDWRRDLLAIFPDFSVEVLETRDLGKFVIGTVRLRGHGLDSDTPSRRLCGGQASGVGGECSGGRPSKARLRPSKPLKGGSSDGGSRAQRPSLGFRVFDRGCYSVADSSGPSDAPSP